jgi:hypothetical protein
MLQKKGIGGVPRVCTTDMAAVPGVLSSRVLAMSYSGDIGLGHLLRNLSSKSKFVKEGRLWWHTQWILCSTGLLLCEVHEKAGLVHMDVKPSNVVVPANLHKKNNDRFPPAILDWESAVGVGADPTVLRAYTEKYCARALDRGREQAGPLVSSLWDHESLFLTAFSLFESTAAILEKVQNEETWKSDRKLALLHAALSGNSNLGSIMHLSQYVADDLHSNVFRFFHDFSEKILAKYRGEKDVNQKFKKFYRGGLELCETHLEKRSKSKEKKIKNKEKKIKNKEKIH